MKRIAKTLAIVTLATAASASFAAETSAWPSEAQDQYSLSQEFPNLQTYEQTHRASEAEQAPIAYPAEALQEYPLSSEFPNIVTYAQQHRNDPAVASNTSMFPAEALDQVALSSEFPRMQTYADLHGVHENVARENSAPNLASMDSGNTR
jgi:hypothetical protein